MNEPAVNLLRIRVVNRSPNLSLIDGFENAAGINTTWWHSLGTEGGTDNSITYWAPVNGGAWSYASHIATPPATADAILAGGHADTSGSFIWQVRESNVQLGGGIGICVDGTGDGYYTTWHSGNTVKLWKRVAAVYTELGSLSIAWVAGTAGWLYLSLVGTTLKFGWASDSAGAPGIFTTTTVADTTFNAGRVSLRANNVAGSAFGGAFVNVATLIGTGPAGSAGSWIPLVTAGEPAFAWSKVTPAAGTYSASIYNANASGNGAWQQATRLNASSSGVMTAQAKASAGTANVTMTGGLTTSNAGTSFAQISGTGSVSVQPIVSCNYSGAIGTAYFDSLSYIDPAYEITTDLPHLHQSSWNIAAMQPGNPGSSAIGSFSIKLHPPGTEGFAAAKPIYDALDYYHRVEAYISPDGASLGKLFRAGVITGLPKQYGPSSSYELTGMTDLALANLSRPFPGELTSNDVTSAILKNYMGMNEAGWMDTFSPFTAANYTTAAIPGNSNGTWTGTTDDGFPVATCSTGSGTAFISKSGAAAHDRFNTQYVECTGRLSPSADGANAGKVGVALTKASGDMNNSTIGFVTVAKQNGRYLLNATITVMLAGVGANSTSTAGALINIDDPQGMIPLTVGLLCTTGGNPNGVNASLIVNGRVVIAQLLTSYDPLTGTNYPALIYGTPATGTATCYLTNLIQMTRFSADGASSAAVFAPGSISTSTHSLGYGMDPGPTFLEFWTKCATREGWYWRYTPQPFVSGTRTLGTLDFAADPGADLTKSVTFSRADGNLTDLNITGNADSLASGTAVSAGSSPDGGGQAIWFDIGALTKYGVISDQSLAMVAPDFNTGRRFAYQITANKITTSSAGSKTATVICDPTTIRELDRITLDDPEMGINKLTSRIIGIVFTEGRSDLQLVLDQFSADDTTLISKRFQQAVFESADIAKNFGTAAGAAPSGLVAVVASANFAAGGNQGGYSTANSSTWTDITNTSFAIVISKSTWFEYRIFATGHITAGAAKGYVRGTIVGFDSTASPWYEGATVNNGFLWYFPYTAGPLQPGTYTVKLQAATDANTTTLTIDQFFHQVLLYAG